MDMMGMTYYYLPSCLSTYYTYLGIVHLSVALVHIPGGKYLDQLDNRSFMLTRFHEI